MIQGCGLLRRAASIGALACLATVGLTGSAWASYSIERIAGPGSYATGINSHGEVVGRIGTGSTYPDAFSWTQAGGMVDLGPDGIVGVNDNGTVALDRIVGTKTKRVAGVVLVSPNGSKTRLPLLTSASAIGNEALIGTDKYGTVVWSLSLGATYDYVSSSTTGVWPDAVSENGYKVAGNFSWPGGTHAFFWSPSTTHCVCRMVDVGAFLPNGWGQQATGVNDSGEVVGYGGLPDPTSHPEPITHVFTYARRHGVVILRLPCQHAAGGTAINDSGQIVGYCTSYNQWETGKNHPFIYTPGSGMAYLSTNGKGATATAVNNSGQVVGQMNTSEGSRAVLWHPVKR